MGKVMEDLRVPVDRVTVDLTLADGRRRRGTLFVPPGSPVEDVLATRDAFVPVEEDGKVRLYASAALACITVASGDEPTESERMPEERRCLSVRLKSGEVIEGELRYVPMRARPRTADLLNEAGATITLHTAGGVRHVVKAHVECVEEAQ
jgi:hypothetical protein